MNKTKTLFALSAFGLSVALVLTGMMFLDQGTVSAQSPPYAVLHIEGTATIIDNRLSEKAGDVSIDLYLENAPDGAILSQCGVTRSGIISGPFGFVTATRGVDYTLPAFNVSLNAENNYRASTTLTIVDDGVIDDDAEEIFTLFAFCRMTQGGGLVGSRTSVWRIVDAQQQQAARRMRVRVNEFTLAEDGNPLSVTMSIEPVPPYGRTVTWDDCGLRTTGGTAIEGSDYTLAPNNLEFAPPRFEHTTTITPINDATIERDETLVIEGFCDITDQHAREDYGENLTSTIVRITLTDDDAEALIPGAPVRLQAGVHAQHMRLSWLAPVQNGDAVTEYIVYRRASRRGEDFVPIGTTTQRNKDDNQAADAVAYDYVVRAVNGRGVTSENSNVVSIGRNLTAPDKVVDLTATVITTQTQNIVTARISWRMPVARNGVSMPNHFAIYRYLKGSRTGHFQGAELIGAGDLNEFSTEQHEFSAGLTHRYYDAGTETYSFIETWDMSRYNHNDLGFNNDRLYRYVVATSLEYGFNSLTEAPQNAPYVPFKTLASNDW